MDLLKDRSIAEKDIKSRWVVETGRWNEEDGGFTDREKTEQIKQIKMLLLERISKDGQKQILLQFLGGPTGYECYYASALMESKNRPSGKELCICGGTINRWPACYVPILDVLGFIRENKQAE